MTDAPGLAANTAPAPRTEPARVGRVLAFLAVATLVALAASLLHPRVRTRLVVGWYGFRTSSPDPMVRAGARQALLDIGRPAIDPVFADLVAGEVADEVEGVPGILLVVARRERPAAKPGIPPLAGAVSFDVDEVVATDSDALRTLFAKRGSRLTVHDTIVCPTAQRLVDPKASRELVLAGSTQTSRASLRVAVPLDDALGPEILEAVRERLAHPPARHPAAPQAR